MTASQGEKKRLLLALLLLAVPVLVFYGVLWHERTGIPIVDDYSALLGYALDWRHLPDFMARCVSILTVQDTEYKLIVDHLAVVASLATTGRVSLIALSTAGNLMLLPVLWVWWRNTATEETVLWRRIFLFLPVAFLLFQLNYAETVNWAMAGLQNLTVIAASLLAIDLLLRPKWASAIGACCAALLACCASANGFLLFPIGLWHLARRRRLGWLLVWCAVFLLCTAAYLYRMQWVQRSKPGLGQLVSFAINLLGGGFENMHRQPLHGLSMCIGLLMVLSVALIAVSGWMRRNPFAASALLWTMLTCLLIAIGRAGLGEAYAFSSRYKIYSDLMLIGLYACGVDVVRRAALRVSTQKVLYSGALFCSALLCVSSDVFGWRFLHSRRQDLQAAFQEWKSSKGTMPPMHDPQVPKHSGLSDTERRARGILESSLKAGLYRIPER